MAVPQTDGVEDFQQPAGDLTNATSAEFVTANQTQVRFTAREIYCFFLNLFTNNAEDRELMKNWEGYREKYRGLCD